MLRTKNILKKIKNDFNNSPDLNTRIIKHNNTNIIYIYLETLCSDNKISNFLVKSLTITLNNLSTDSNIYKKIYEKLNNNLYNSKIKKIKDINDIKYHILNGYTIIIIDGYKEFIAVETKETLDRGISEVESEITIKGPKDSFSENINTNIGLIRKRIKDDKLEIKEFIIGEKTKSKVEIIYINDIAKKENVSYIINKIKKINIDGILDIGYIRDFIINDNKSTFPLVINTERPDIACSKLLEGRIVITTENSPNVIILPGLLNNFIHSPEDNYQKAINVSLTRFLRFLAFLITITTPALYIALTTFNQEVIPDTLLISLALERAKVPFPNAFSIFILMTTFEILRESDIRLPSSMGSSMSIVGALVLGDAAVSAGLVSPMAVIVIAITSITGLLFTDLDITNAFRIWRIIFLIFSATMGLIGFVIAGIIFTTKLTSLESIGVDYLLPFSPFNKNIFNDSILTSPRNKMKNRENYLTNNIRRLK